MANSPRALVIGADISIIGTGKPFIDWVVGTSAANADICGTGIQIVPTGYAISHRRMAAESVFTEIEGAGIAILLAGLPIEGWLILTPTIKARIKSTWIHVITSRHGAHADSCLTVLVNETGVSISTGCSIDCRSQRTGSRGRNASSHITVVAAISADDHGGWVDLTGSVRVTEEGSIAEIAIFFTCAFSVRLTAADRYSGIAQSAQANIGSCARVSVITSGSVR